jgi:hypothetical protein
MPQFHCDQGRKASPNKIGPAQARLFDTYEKAAWFIEKMRNDNPTSTYDYHIIKREYGKYEVRPIT